MYAPESFVSEFVGLTYNTFTQASISIEYV